MKKLLDSTEILDLLGIHLNTFYRIMQRDPTFPVRKIGRHWKADPDELEAWVKQQPTYFSHDENIVPIEPRRRGRPPLSGTNPRRAAK